MAKIFNGKRYSFGEYFDRKDAAERRAKQYGEGWKTRIIKAGKVSGWKWALYFRKDK